MVVRPRARAFGRLARAAALAIATLLAATCGCNEPADTDGRVGPASLLGKVTQVSLDFGQTPIDGFSERRFHIVNIGTGPLLGKVTSTCAAFVVVEGGEPYLLLPADSLEVAVEFRPDSIGAFACSLSTGGRCPPVDAFGIGLPPVSLFCTARALPNPARVSQPVNFIGTAFGASGNESYMWTFGTGDSAFVSNPPYVYLTTGSFEAILTVFDGPPPPKICRDTVLVNVLP